MDLDLYDLLKRANREEILTIITMSVKYFTETYNFSFDTTMRLVKKGYKELEKRKGV